MKIIRNTLNKNRIKNAYTSKQLNKLKIYCKLGKNRRYNLNDVTEELAKCLNIDDELFCITKFGIFVEHFKGTNTIGKNLRIIGEKYTFFAKDLGFLIFTNEDDLVNRLKELKAKRNLSLIKHDDFNWMKIGKYEDRLKNNLDDFNKIFKILEKKYPIYDHFWNLDQENLYLFPQNNSSIVPDDKKTQRQLDCINGKHMTVKIKDDVYWCQNCGTLITGNFKGQTSIRNPYKKKELDDVTYHYPLFQAFLPNEK